MTSTARLARVAGLLYLIVAVCGGFSQLYVRQGLIVAGDAAATADNVSASATLFRIGFVSDLVGITCFLLTALALYVLFKPVNRRIAAVMVLLVAVSVAIMSVNLLNHLAALLVATGADYAPALGAPAADALVLLLLDLHGHGYLIAQIFFGLWLLPLGYLVVRSGYFPRVPGRVLGVMLTIGCFGYLAELLTVFLAPGLGANLSPFFVVPAAIAELSFVLWLLLKGVSARTRDQDVPAVA